MNRTNYGGRTVPFSMRNLRVEYRDKLRLLAVKMSLPMELVANMALGVGLRALEKKVEENGRAGHAIRAVEPVANG